MQQRPTRVLGYARVSSVGQGVGSSLGDQQNVIRANAASRGLKVEPENMYVEAESAVHEKIEKREQVRALLANVRAGDLVLVDKLDRWSRDPEFTYRSIRELLAAGASFYAIGDACDPSTTEGDTMLGFRVLFAREEHKRIRQRTVGTRKLLRDRGYYVEGLVPFGYARRDVKGVERNVLVIDEAAADVVRRAFALCIQGRSGAEIAARLELHRDRVFHLLSNRAYLGEMRDGQGGWKAALHPPIIDARTFVEAQSALSGRRHGAQRASPSEGAETSTWWLRDVARCGLCGAKMSARYAGPHGPERRYYFACARLCTRRYVRVRVAEAECDLLVRERLVELRAELAAATDERTPARPDVASLAERRERLQRKRARFLELFADGDMSREEMRARLAKLDAERTKLDALERPVVVTTPAQRRAALADVDTMRLAWTKASAQAKRVILAGLARSVLLAHGQPARVEWFESREIAEWGAK